MSLQDLVNQNEVPFNSSALERMPWEKLLTEADKLEEQDRLWKQAQASDALKLAGIFGKSDILGAKGHKAYLEATGSRLSDEGMSEPAAEIAPQNFGKGGPNTTVVKSQTELRNQAEMMVRNGRLGTVQKAMEAIREDWTSKGFKIR